jgi:hypothetical protein
MKNKNQISLLSVSLNITLSSYLLSSEIYLKGFISLNFFKPQSLKLTKNINKHYIFIKQRIIYSNMNGFNGIEWRW